MIKDHLKDKIYTYSKYENKSLDKLNILTCISGGLDSSVLLHALNELRAEFKFNLDAAHVNYSTHKMSNKMQDQCAKTCKAMQINFFAKLVDGSEIKSNFESNARQIRYSYFNKIDKMNSYDFILTAHHKMDQLETVVMKTVTNSSWVSKIGIREYNEKLRRPLLDISKSCIVAYAENNNIIFKNDPTNTDYSLLRNNIRLVLERHNSSKVEDYYINLSRSLKHKFDKLIISLDKAKIVRRNLNIS